MQVFGSQLDACIIFQDEIRESLTSSLFVSVVFRKVTKECSRIASHLPSKHSYMVITTYIANECGMPICDDDSIQSNG